MWPNPQVPADLVTFTEEIPNVKLHFLCRDEVAEGERKLNEAEKLKDFAGDEN